MLAAWLLLVIAVGSLSGGCASPGCLARDYGHGSVVCVCNAEHCDVPEPLPLGQLAAGAAAHYVSSKAGERLALGMARFAPLPTLATQEKVATLRVNYDTRFQEVLGFGGAVTDSSAILTHSLSSATADSLVRSYFGDEGIGYTFLRVPLGGCDFSTHKYQYLDDHPGDVHLKHFNLSAEDFEHKIPFIKRAVQVSPAPVKLLAASWSAPEWMKFVVDPTTNASSLKKEYYDAYAAYHVKFLEKYAAEGLDFWGITPQNEPTGGLRSSRWNMMGWQPAEMRQFLAHSFCPALRAAGFDHLKVMLGDDNTNRLSAWQKLYKDTVLDKCVSGMAVHWYTDDETSHSVLEQVHQQHPDKFLLYTEACIEDAVALGSWERGARYISNIIQVLRHWGVGWVDWNLVLDERGGPNWAGNFVDAPVVANASADEFYKQPMFYALAHVSRFVPPGSVRVGLEGPLEGAAFLTPDRSTVIVLLGRADGDTEAVISDAERGSLSLRVPANSMHTVVYKQHVDVRSEL
ncbi:lysosomal acid glucosylceramidase-like [Bacillus rossius redtenbacheri]|uniref:lysosomal acid glucosylceramidase-like n=1 Tax=Bacillus rossius redtenbacheri TaxID=93214 RepID=UPI002FDCF24A